MHKLTSCCLPYAGDAAQKSRRRCRSRAPLRFCCAAAATVRSRKAHIGYTLEVLYVPFRELRLCAAQLTPEGQNALRTTGTPLHVMIAGAPAAGKGTQCQRIVEKVPHSWRVY